MNYRMRQRRLQRRLSKSNSQALLVSAPENVAYLTGFESTHGFVLLTADATVVLTDFRYEPALRALAESQDFTPVIVRGGLARELRRLCTRHSVRRIAYEATHLTVDQFTTLARKTPKLKWHPAPDWLAGARNRKDDDELDCMRRAVLVAEEGFTSFRSQNVLGVREDEAADMLETCLKAAARVRGLHATASFPIIVAAGVNAAVPHHHPGATVIEEGMMVTIDWGARVDGYCSDMTRTIFLGQPDAKFRKVYRTVLRAQKKAIAAYRSGVALKTVDRAARDVIAGAGYAHNFGHGTGHGIGREVHEGFSASPRGKGRVKCGMVCTIEPGIYIPGWGGVRIEDMVVVSGGRTEMLTSLRK